LVGGDSGDVGEGREKAGYVGDGFPEVSELYEGDLDEMDTVEICRLLSDDCEFAPVFDAGLTSSS